MQRLVGAGLCLAIVLAANLETGFAARSANAYRWPLRPFGQQHPIRAVFGDPRTLDAAKPFGDTSPEGAGDYSFHNGIDIVGDPGTPVYPVVSGRVTLAGTGEIVVLTRDNRRFQYWHLLRQVHVGQSVVADRTVLGLIQSPADHVHFAEIDSARSQNPLAAGHLGPYRDWTTPEVGDLYVYTAGHGAVATSAVRIGARQRLAVAAADIPPLSEPGHFFDLPQAPALVEWRLLHDGRWSAWTVASDFRRTEPPAWDFWKVYAPGTYQNQPVFDHRLFLSTPGEYRFRLGLDPGRLSPGRHKLEVLVADIRGNNTTATWPLQISRSPVGPTLDQRATFGSQSHPRR